jgi:hypothetical protein
VPQAKDLARAKTKLLATMSHELRCSAVTLLVHCWYTVVTPLFICCYTVVALLLH